MYRRAEPYSRFTSRTLHGRFLLRPGPELNELLLGVLGRAQRLYQMEIYACAFLSNHFHLLIRTKAPEQLAGFMRYFKGKLGKEIGRLYGWREKVWGRRYRPIQVSDEIEAQVARLRYILSQACKEGLVASPLDWPGVNSAQALIQGTDLTGLWFDRTKEFYARRRGENFAPAEFATQERVTFSPLPCWVDLTAGQIRAAVSEIVGEIEREAKKRISGGRPAGKERILRQHPHERPARTTRSPAPRFHAATQRARRSMRTTYSLFLAAYRRATDSLAIGRGPVSFPEGCFPPRLPFSEVPYQPVPG